MDAIETSRKRSADDAGRGGVQPNPTSMADDSMQEAVRDAATVWADSVALAEAYSLARFQQRAGASGLTASMAMDLPLGWDRGLVVDQVKAQTRLGDEKPHLLIFESHVFGFLPVVSAQHKARPTGRTVGAGQASLGVCVQSGRVAGRARWTRFLRASLGGDDVERAVPEKVVGDGWHAQGPMRSMSVRNDFG